MVTVHRLSFGYLLPRPRAGPYGARDALVRLAQFRRVGLPPLARRKRCLGAQVTYYIDPGTAKGCAVACFGTRGLIGLGRWYMQDGFKAYWGDSAQGPSLWEMPQIYPRGPGSTPAQITATANDLIVLSAHGSACATYLSYGRGGTRAVLPRQWKKQASKPAHHLRVLPCLTAPEVTLLVEAYGKPLDVLVSYITAASRAVGMRQTPSYGAQITDLLDAIALGLWDTNRLRV